MQRDYSLVGSMPTLDSFRDSLPALITSYKAERPQMQADADKLGQVFAQGGLNAVDDYMRTRMQDPEVARRISVGFTLEMCAQHFYGISTEGMDMAEVVAALEAAEQEAEFGA